MVLLCVLPLGAGCRQTSRPQARVELLSNDGREFEQEFAAARYARSNSGNFDIILLDQTEGLSRTAEGTNKPLLSTDASPLTHLMHVRVLWRATQAIRASSPSASNATVQWSVLSRDGGRLDYSGAGFARVFGGDPGEPIRVQLTAVRFAPGERSGGLEDPIGAGTMETSFKAFPDEPLVRTALEMIRTAGRGDAPVDRPLATESAQPIQPPAPAYPGPPARQPSP